jgi:hypothetical protein
MKSLLNKIVAKPALAALAAATLLFAGCDKSGSSNGQTGEFSPLGLPKETVAVAHINLKNAYASKVGAKVRDIVRQQYRATEPKSEMKEFDDFLDGTGLDIERDIAGITYGILFDDAGATPGKKPNLDSLFVVGVARGKFSVEKINAYIAKQDEEGKLKKKTVGKIQFSTNSFGTFGLVDANTLLIVSGNPRAKPEKLDATLEKILAAFTAANAYDAPKSFLDLEKAFPKTVLLAHADVERSAFIKALFDSNSQAKMFRPLTGQVVAGEDGDKFKLRAVVQYDDPTKAQGLSGLAGLGIGMLKSQIGTEAPDLVKTLNALKLRVEDKTFVIEAEEKSGEIIRQLEDALAKASKRE